ncbi:hypothetical protein Tco_0213582 [Tanacetum coccineum]
MLDPSPNLLDHGERLEILDYQLCAIWKNLGHSEWSTPAGLKLARENLQYRVKEEDSITDVENAVFDLGVMDSLCFLLVCKKTISVPGSDNTPPMLDRTDFESWKTTKVSDVIAGGTEGAVQQGPVRARVLTTFQLKNKDKRYKAVLSVQPNIYFKMILEGSELTKDDRESQLYDEFEHFYQIKGETIQDIQVVKESNFDQLYAYLKQHEVHANENRIMMERIPYLLDNFKWTRRSSSTKNLIESLSNSLALITQSYKSNLPQTNDQLRASSNARNKAMVQEGKVVVQDVRGRYNANNQGRPFQRNNARGNGVAGNVGGQNRGGIINPGQAKPIKLQRDDDVDDSPENDLALNVDHVLKLMNMMHSTLMFGRGSQSHRTHVHDISTSVRSNIDEAGTSYDSNTPSELCEDNEDHVVQRNVSSVRNDALMSILDEMHEQGVQSRLANKPDMIINDSVASELARYKELVREYEKRAKFELTDRERKIDEQMRIIISDRNRKETSLKSELHSAQILLSSTVGHYKSKTEEVIILKKDFKQKEDKFLEEFLDIKRLKDKIEDRYTKQDLSVALYNESMYLSLPNHTPLSIHGLRGVQREIAEITRKRMLLKMQSPLCVENKVRISPPPPPDYSKENLLATFAPQRNLTPEQIFWSIDDNNRKKAETSVPKPILALTVYPPNTPVKLVPRILPTKKSPQLTEGERGFEQTKRCYLTEVIPFFKTLKQHFEGVQKALFKEVKEMEEIFDQMSAEVDQNTVDKQCAEIERKNLLIANENLIANCLSNQLMFAVEQSRCLDLEAEISKLQNENQKDVNDEMIRGFNKLEVEYLNLQLKYQHRQENFGNNKSQTSQDVPEFDLFFRIKILKTQLQEKDNVIRNLKAQVSKMNDRSCETDNAKDVTALIEQNECVRVELEKVKQHYKELYDSIKITRVYSREQISTMLNEIEILKAQLKRKVSCVTSDSVKPKVLAPGMYAIDVKPIPYPLKNNRSAHLNYINHLKESVETVREIVEEARVAKPHFTMLVNTLSYLRNC